MLRNYYDHMHNAPTAIPIARTRYVRARLPYGLRRRGSKIYIDAFTGSHTASMAFVNVVHDGKAELSGASQSMHAISRRFARRSNVEGPYVRCPIRSRLQRSQKCAPVRSSEHSANVVQGHPARLTPPLTPLNGSVSVFASNVRYLFTPHTCIFMMS